MQKLITAIKYTLFIAVILCIGSVDSLLLSVGM